MAIRVAHRMSNAPGLSASDIAIITPYNGQVWPSGTAHGDGMHAHVLGLPSMHRAHLVRYARHC